MSSSDDSKSGCLGLIAIGLIIWFWEYILVAILGILLLVLLWFLFFLLWFLFFGKGAKVRKIKKHVRMIEGAQWMTNRASAIEAYLKATNEDSAVVLKTDMLNKVHRRLGFTNEEIQRAASEK